jgi:hypothetical protein
MASFEAKAAAAQASASGLDRQIYGSVEPSNYVRLFNPEKRGTTGLAAEMAAGAEALSLALVGIGSSGGLAQQKAQADAHQRQRCNCQTNAEGSHGLQRNSELKPPVIREHTREPGH